MKPSISIIIMLFLSSTALLFSQSPPVKAYIKSNGFRLDASFYPSGADSPRPAVILLHGFPGNQSSPLGLAVKLSSAGVNVLVFNYQGSYASEGEFSFDNSINNVKAAYDFLTDPENISQYGIDTSVIVVCGYSYGGTIALEAGMYNPHIKNIIAIANDDHSVSLRKASSDPEFHRKYIDFISRSFGPEGPFRGDMKKQFDYYIANIHRYDLASNAELLRGKKVFFIVGFRDNTSLMEINTFPLYRKLIQINSGMAAMVGFDTDHRFGNVSDALASAIIEWISRL